jgi:hypothetical protein
LAATALSALKERWQPLDLIAMKKVFSDVDTMLPVLQLPGERTPTSIAAKLEVENAPIYDSFEMSVHENPLHHGTYKIMLFLAADRVPVQSEKGLLFTYTFTPESAPHARPTLQLKSVVSSLAAVPSQWTTMSYAGYCIQRPHVAIAGTGVAWLAGGY